MSEIENEFPLTTVIETEAGGDAADEQKGKPETAPWNHWRSEL